MANKDPRTKYHQEGFNKQKQAYPGVQAEMDFVPDCGEESYECSGKLKGLKALISGGDSGIGRAAAIAYAREGADVAITYLESEEQDAQEVKRYIEDAGQTAVLIPGDLREEQFARDVVNESVEKLGGLDVLVLNAGYQQWEPELQDFTLEHMTETFTVNVFSQVFMMQEAEKHMKPGGSIILTTSIQAFSPANILMDYAMTKSAQVSLVKSLMSPFIQKGIRINGVAPGPVWTALQISGGQPQDKIEKFGESSPLGRAGQPAELAAVYVLLASEEASFITGEVYGVTGGGPIV